MQADGNAFIVHPDAEDLAWASCPDFLPEGYGIAVLQGDPADHNTDILLRVPARSTIPYHWHTSAERMVLVAGEFHVEYDGQEPVVMRQGTYAYGPPRLPHEAQCRSDEDCLLFIAFAFTWANAFMVVCDTRDEIDQFWKAMSAQSQAERCGQRP